MNFEEISRIMDAAGDKLLDDYTKQKWRGLDEDQLDFVADVICDLKYEIRKQLKNQIQKISAASTCLPFDRLRT